MTQKTKQEQIDWLLRQRFGPLAPPPLPSLGAGGSFHIPDTSLVRAKVRRDAAMAGKPDPLPPIDALRSELSAKTQAEVRDIYQAALAKIATALAAKEAEKMAARAKGWPIWAKKDLWSQAELAEICCGRLPGEPDRTDAEQMQVSAAIEDISRGVLSKNLAYIARDDADTASRMYNTHRHFLPTLAAKWAVVRFDAFPAALAHLVKPTDEHLTPKSLRQESAKPLDVRERTTLLTIVGALAKEARIDIGEPFKAGATIEALIASMGLTPPSSSTIGQHLKAVPEALDKRRK